VITYRSHWPNAYTSATQRCIRMSIEAIRRSGEVPSPKGDLSPKEVPKAQGLPLDLIPDLAGEAEEIDRHRGAVCPEAGSEPKRPERKQMGWGVMYPNNGTTETRGCGLDICMSVGFRRGGSWS
jgi:hypothetical protein